MFLNLQFNSNFGSAKCRETLQPSIYSFSTVFLIISFIANSPSFLSIKTRLPCVFLLHFWVKSHLLSFLSSAEESLPSSQNNTSSLVMSDSTTSLWYRMSLSAVMASSPGPSSVSGRRRCPGSRWTWGSPRTRSLWHRERRESMCNRKGEQNQVIKPPPLSWILKVPYRAHFQVHTCILCFY